MGTVVEFPIRPFNVVAPLTAAEIAERMPECPENIVPLWRYRETLARRKA